MGVRFPSEQEINCDFDISEFNEFIFGHSVTIPFSGAGPTSPVCFPGRLYPVSYPAPGLAMANT